MKRLKILFYRLFVDGCYNCKHEGKCDFIGYCGNYGMSFYSSKKGEE